MNLKIYEAIISVHLNKEAPVDKETIKDLCFRGLINTEVENGVILESHLTTYAKRILSKLSSEHLFFFLRDY
jgi:hypothetical protein